MAPRYSKLTTTKKVSFEDDPTRYDFEAPYDRNQDPPRAARPARVFDTEKMDDSDDEVDKLLQSDPLADKEGTKLRRPRLSRKKRRVLIFGFITFVALLIVAISAVGVTTHKRVKSQAQAKEVQAALDEVKDMTEVPTLIGTVPVSSADLPAIENAPDMPHLVHVEPVISVPETHEPVHDEEADRAAYEAGLAPPELSEEAVSQAQEINSVLAPTAVGPVATMKGYAEDFWNWIEASWKDLMANDADSDEIIY